VKEYSQMKALNSQIGKKVIVRADKAGVFFGTLIAKNDLEVQLADFRKLYYWSGANAIEQIALEGVKNPEDCKFTVVNKEVTISNYIQIITCTDTAIANLESVSIWKKL
jgi:hypothetical protein